MIPLIWLAALPTVSAWSSPCFDEADGTECDGGAEGARLPWFNDGAGWGALMEEEHAHIFFETAELAGIPVALAQDKVRWTYVSDGAAVEGGFTSTIPTASDPALVVTRDRYLAEFAQLPDWSYTLWDWVTGNETCPISDALSATECHTFEGWMGGMNSSHFLPQSEYFWGHYHQMALTRAAECKAIAESVEDQAHLADYAKACEIEALALEAVGHHYLQDAWSSGHMWERWGSPDYRDWRTLSQASLVGGISGTWHGAKAVADPLILESDALMSSVVDMYIEAGEPVPDVNRLHVDDPLCAPPPSGEAITAIDPLTSEAIDVAGDIFLHNVDSDAFWSDQKRAMYSCAANSLREVYEATGMVHGELDALSGSVDADRLPSTGACWDQRITNAALEIATGVHVGESPNQVFKLDTIVLIALSAKLTRAEDGVGAELVAADTRADAAASIARVAFWAREDPEGTQTADGGQGNLDNIRPNGDYMTGRIVGDLADPPATWLEPSYPWSPSSEDFATRSMALAFSDSHAADRCPELSVAELERFRPSAYGTDADTDRSSARTQLCRQMVAPHLRIGNAEDYDTSLEPLCALTGGADFVYIDGNYGTHEDAVDAYCKDSDQALLVDGSFEDRDASWELESAQYWELQDEILAPTDGDTMVNMYVDADQTQRWSILKQALRTSTLDGSYTLSFDWMVVTDPTNAGCNGSDSPWMVARIDSTLDGNTILVDRDRVDWCSSTEEYLSGSWQRTDWTSESVTFSAATRDPVLTFQVGASNPHNHRVFIDNVVLEGAD